jgi:hypothetical protein
LRLHSCVPAQHLCCVSLVLSTRTRARVVTTGEAATETGTCVCHHNTGYKAHAPPRCPTLPPTGSDTQGRVPQCCTWLQHVSRTDTHSLESLYQTHNEHAGTQTHTDTELYTHSQQRVQAHTTSRHNPGCLQAVLATHPTTVHPTHTYMHNTHPLNPNAVTAKPQHHHVLLSCTQLTHTACRCPAFCTQMWKPQGWTLNQLNPTPAKASGHT